MIAYNFKDEFEPQLKSGEKTLTLRRFRKQPARHCNVGEFAGLWIGQRTKQARRPAVGFVNLRALVRFDASGIVFVSELRLRSTDDAACTALQRELIEAESDTFARRDGFENWAAAWAWHDRNRDKEERGLPSLVRELVAWRPLTPEQIAEVDSGRAYVEDAA